MTERLLDDGAVANGFGHRFLHEWVACLMHEANYPMPHDMHVPGEWRMSVGGVPMPPSPFGAERDAKIAWIRESLLEGTCQHPRYAPDNRPLWPVYFQRRHAEQLTSSNGAPAPRGSHNSDDRRQWWGIPRRTLHAVLEHLEGGNEPPLKYSTPSFSRQSGSSWLSRRVTGSSSSSSGSRSSGAATPPVTV
ncbi:Homeobox protein KNOX3 [Hordeum vulgare]|nr:Homeobox protein KNOX3 [Hordeum vulgare]